MIMKLQTPNRKRLIATRASIALCIVLLGVIFIPPLLRRHTSRGIINAYLATKAVHMLQIGAGDSEKDGWLNTDIEPRAKEAFLDASKPFPLPDQCMHYVHSEHVIEHLTFDGGQVMLKESFRVLDHGGRVRIATPSLVKVVAVLQDPPTPAAAEYVAGKAVWHKYPQTADPGCFLVNHQMREFGHRFLYTPKLLRARPVEAGFVDIKEYAVGESDDPGLRNVEVRATWDEAKLNAYETFVLEGVKP
jgi:predicted SAM-dependent methyltransferase